MKMDYNEMYRIIGVRRDASMEEIKRTYDARVRRLMSEDYADEPEYSSKRLSLLMEAYRNITQGTAYRQERERSRLEEYNEKRRAVMQESIAANREMMANNTKARMSEQTDAAASEAARALPAVGAGTGGIMSGGMTGALPKPPVMSAAALKAANPTINYSLPKMNLPGAAPKEKSDMLQTPIGGKYVTDMAPKKHIEDCEMSEADGSMGTDVSESISRRTSASRLGKASEKTDSPDSSGSYSEGGRSYAGNGSARDAFKDVKKMLQAEMQKRAANSKTNSNSNQGAGSGITDLKRMLKPEMRKRLANREMPSNTDQSSISDQNSKYDESKLKASIVLFMAGLFCVFILAPLLGSCSNIFYGSVTVRQNNSVDVMYTDDDIDILPSVLAYVESKPFNFQEKISFDEAENYSGQVSFDYSFSEENAEALDELCFAMGIECSAVEATRSYGEYIRDSPYMRDSYEGTRVYGEWIRDVDMDEFNFEDASVYAMADLLDAPLPEDIGGGINLYTNTPILNTVDYIDFLRCVVEEQRDDVIDYGFYD